ncbi:MAG: SPOR domain-containing protein, partial [Pseudomonadales bacterium]
MPEASTRVENLVEPQRKTSMMIPVAPKDQAKSKRRARSIAVVLMTCLVLVAPSFAAERLIFGSFRIEAAAVERAAELQALLGFPVRVASHADQGSTWYRVQSVSVSAAESARIVEKCQAQGIEFWRQSLQPAPVSALAQTPS